MNLVHVVEDGERVQMSKRSGDFVSLDELLDDIGVDATRWFMLWRSHETTVDLDLAAGPQPVEREPGLLRPVRARPDRQHPAQSRRRRRGGGGRPRPRGAGGGAGAEREGADQAPARVPRRGARSRRRGGRRTGSAPTRPRSPPTSTPSTATARWSAPRARGSSARGWRSASATKRTIAAALGLLGISAPERM